MLTKTNESQQAWVFFAVTFFFSWLFWIPNALVAQGVTLPTSWTNFLSGSFNPAAFGPSLTAFLLTFLQQGGKGVLELLKRGMDFRFKKIWLLAILLIPFIVFGGSVWVSVLAGARAADFSVISNLPYVLVGFFAILFTAGPLQEEFGWRGYALPRLQSRFGGVIASLIVGVFWWLWHLPAVFIPGRFMADSLVVFLAVGIVITLASFLFTWIYNNTNGSILAAMLTHTALNWSIWSAMPNMKMDLPTAGFMIGFLTILTLIILTRNRLEGNNNPKPA